jgi:hypothetical protein
VPRSALPVWFVRDQMIDGGMFGHVNEGTDETELGRLPGVARSTANRPVILREDAERLAFAQLTPKELAQIRLGPMGGPMRRVLHPWVRLRVERQDVAWLIRYDTIDLKLDVATGRVERHGKR